MPAKLTTDQVRNKMNDYGLFLLSKNYEGISKDIKVKCKEGHSYTTKYKNIKKAQGCIECKRLEPLRKFKKYVSNISDGHRLITKENEFKRTADKLKFVCPLGHNYHITMSHFREGKRCSECKGNRISKSKRLSKKQIIKRYNDRGYEIISGLDEYRNSLSYLIVECPNGHIYKSAVGNFCAGHGCGECFRDIQYLLIPRGENSQNWKGGISPLKEIFRNSIKGWKKKSMHASNYKCVITNGKFEHIHHLYPFHKIFREFMSENSISIKTFISEFTNEELKNIVNDFVEFHNDFGLGVCLSLEVHNLFHSIYGYDTNETDFMKFKENFSMSNLDEINYI